MLLELNHDRPLNREQGELQTDLGPHDLPIPPNHKWGNTPFFDGAAQMAIESFHKTAEANRTHTHSRIDDDDWFAQEYHRAGRLVFFFQRRILIRKRLHDLEGNDIGLDVHDPGVVRTVFPIGGIRMSFPPEALGDLVSRGLWPPMVLSRMPAIGSRSLH